MLLRNIASLVGCWCFLFMTHCLFSLLLVLLLYSFFARIHFSSRAERSVVKDLVYIHLCFLFFMLSRSFVAMLLWMTLWVKASLAISYGLAIPTSEAMWQPHKRLPPAFSVEAWRKIEYFPWRTKSCLSVSEFFSFRKIVWFFSFVTGAGAFLFVSFSLCGQRKKKSPYGWSSSCLSAASSFSLGKEWKF